MSKRSPQISISQNIITALFCVFSILGICGCGDFFAHKSAELQTQVILGDVREIEENLQVKNPLPDIYRGSAKRIRVKDGIKLFYFQCIFHPLYCRIQNINVKVRFFSLQNRCHAF